MRKPELGQVVGGKYRLLRELGRGGMATVFEAQNELTLKHAAVKWLHPQFHDEGQGLQRVLREARAASRIRHENVVDVYDVAEEASAVYLVMELLKGELLSQVLDREELPVHELIALLVPAMRGVAAAHAAGVVHRDIKPDNIFLAREASHERAVPKLIDFGISKVADPDPANVTRSGVTMGTPRYASYEQLLGARDVDVRTDVYAFGVILYESLTGRAPYGDAITFAEQAVRFATRDLVPVRSLRPEVPEELEQLVHRAVAKQREDRTPSLEALLLELVPFADPGKYLAPLWVRSQTPVRARATLLEGRRGSAVAKVSEILPAPSPERGKSRRRGLMLAAVGIGTMALALLSMRFESPPHTRAARMPDELWDAGIASQPTLGSVAAAAEDLAQEHAQAEPPAPPRVEPPVKKPRRTPSIPPVAPESPALETPPPDSLHRAGPLRRSEF